MDVTSRVILSEIAQRESPRWCNSATIKMYVLTIVDALVLTGQGVEQEVKGVGHGIGDNYR